MSKASNEANTAEILGIDDAEIATRRSLLQIGPDDEAVMSGLDAMSRERLPEWLNDIESHFRAFPEAARALEEAGAPYTAERLVLKQNDQRKPEYLKINPKGRVPALVAEHGILTETPAILSYSAQSFPAAKLF